MKFPYCNSCAFIWKRTRRAEFSALLKYQFMAVWSFWNDISLPWWHVKARDSQTAVLPPVMMNKWRPMGRHTFSRLLLQLPWPTHLFRLYFPMKSMHNLQSCCFYIHHDVAMGKERYILKNCVPWDFLNRASPVFSTQIRKPAKTLLLFRLFFGSCMGKAYEP